MDKAPIWWQDAATALIQFCTGYMIYDASVNIFWTKRATGVPSEDYVFLAHHVVTILYMTSTRIVGAGHQSAMMCMFLGECTNPLHNAFYIMEKALQLDCCNGPLAQQVFSVIQVTFSIVYLIVRGPIAPALFLPMTWDLWAHGRKHIPVWIIFVWSLFIWGVLFGSIQTVGAGCVEVGRTHCRRSSRQRALKVCLVVFIIKDAVHISTTSRLHQWVG
jgi:hypothetical protein